MKTKPQRVEKVGNGVEENFTPPKFISGDTASKTWNAFTNARGNFHVGHWASGACKIKVSYTEDEFCMLTKGACVLTDALGNATRFDTGQPFVIPSGFVGAWESIGDVEKIYVILE